MATPADRQPALDEDRDLERLFATLARPERPTEGFEAELAARLAARLAIRRAEGELPAGWALCPFDRFCFAAPPVPPALGAHCPCLHGAPLLRRLRGRWAAVHARPCAGLRDRGERAPGSDPSGADAGAEKERGRAT